MKEEHCSRASELYGRGTNSGGGWWEGKINERRALFTRLAETSAPGKRCGQNV